MDVKPRMGKPEDRDIGNDGVERVMTAPPLSPTRYTEEDVQRFINDAAKRGANETAQAYEQRFNQRFDGINDGIKNLSNIPYQHPPQQAPRRSGNSGSDDSIDSGDDGLGMSSKLVKQLQTTVEVFNALKNFSSNPLQKAIENRVGDMAAGVIEQAFARPQGPPPKKDILDTFLNSQLGYGLGQGIGSRGPEFIDSLGRLFGHQKAEQVIDGMLGKYGAGKPGGDGAGVGGQEGGGGVSGNGGGGSSGGPVVTDPGNTKQSEKEILLSLDPNNPAHVSAYAETQGGISVDVARKMLMIHQDEFIKQMKLSGTNVDEISKVRGTSVGVGQTGHGVVPPSQSPPVVQSPIVGQPVVGQPVVEQSGPGPVQDAEYIEQPPMEYQEYDIENVKTQQTYGTQDITPQLKQFTEDIGKVMGDMVSKIESMNNTIFVLQSEVNEIKDKRPINVERVVGPNVSGPAGAGVAAATDTFDHNDDLANKGVREEIKNKEGIIDSKWEGDESIPGVRIGQRKGRDAAAESVITSVSSYNRSVGKDADKVSIDAQVSPDVSTQNSDDKNNNDSKSIGIDSISNKSPVSPKSIKGFKPVMNIKSERDTDIKQDKEGVMGNVIGEGAIKEDSIGDGNK